MLNGKSMLRNISKGQSSIPLRYIIAGLEEDYAKLKNTIRIMFVEPKKETTTFYLKAPSASIPSLMYDVVFEFHEIDLVRATSETDFKVYCNSPSFYFRYANTFRTYGSLLYPEKYPAMVTDAAKIRNPSQVTGFDKYVYSGLRLLTSNTVEALQKSQYLNKPPVVDSYNQKRFEYIKYKKLAKIAQDDVV